MDKQPAVSLNGLTFLPVPEFSDPELAFGAGEASYFDRRNLPEVPRKFKDDAMRLFYEGGKFPEFGADVDAAKAKRAIRALLSSFAPSHEAKEATVGYALWAWSPEAAAARAAQPA
jgi:hypothetical protein